MGWFEKQAFKFGALAGLMKLEEANERARQEQEQQDVYESAPVQEVQPQQPVQEVPQDGFERMKQRNGLLGQLARNGTIRRPGQ